MSDRQPPINLLSPIASLGRTAIHTGSQAAHFLEHLRQVSLLGWLSFLRSRFWVRGVREGMHQMRILGVDSLPLVASVAAFVGAEMVVQCKYQFSGIIPMRFLGYAVCKTLIMEFGPVFTSIVVSGRIAASMAAELSNMRSTEQLDAMETLMLDPVRYLVVPRVVACVVMMPVLVVFADFVALVVSVFAAISVAGVSLNEYLTSLRMYFSLQDLIIHTMKTSIFGCLVALVSCHFGVIAAKGAQGTGEAASSSVVASCVLILVTDFLVAYLTLKSAL